MKYLMPALRLFVFMSLLLGLIYPFAMTGISQFLFPVQANGNMILKEGQLLGSLSIGQSFERPEYFWSRPSSIGYNPQPSGGSNWGQASEALKKLVEDRRVQLKAAHPDRRDEPPQDLLFASASGLDPHISPEAAAYQIERVAQARHMNLEHVQLLVKAATRPRAFGILGEPVVNVLALNLALDRSSPGAK